MRLRANVLKKIFFIIFIVDLILQCGIVDEDGSR